jgi:hypothetical protein
MARTKSSRCCLAAHPAINCDYPSNEVGTPEYVNIVRLFDLHHFTWRQDDEIGVLDVRWNWLVGERRICIDTQNPELSVVEGCDAASAMPLGLATASPLSSAVKVLILYEIQ